MRQDYSFDFEQDEKSESIIVNGAPLKDLLSILKLLNEFHVRLKGSDYYWHSQKDREDPIKEMVKQISVVTELIKHVIESEPVGKYIDRLSLEERRQLFN